MTLNVRSHTWIQGGLSWAYVSGRILKAFEDMGHNSYFVSTNGIKGSDPFFSEEKMLSSAVELQKFGPGKEAIDIDLTYTVFINFPQRFLANSKNKCVIYNYETTIWPKYWSKYYHIPDFYFPSSDFAAEIFCMNGVDPKKIFVIPHGVDTEVFNPTIPPVKLKTNKKTKFVSVVAPHYRKDIGSLLDAYCRAFTPKDDVCLVLKTKVYKHSDGVFHKDNPRGRKGFEIVLGDIFKDIYKKYGKNIPEIEILGGHVENVSSIYNACDINVTTTSAECFYLPGLESMACGLLNIAPNYSGHLHYMNRDNSLLIDTKLRYVRPGEQYWEFNPKSKTGQVDIDHTAELMKKASKEYATLMEKLSPNMKDTVKEFSWVNAAKDIVNVINGNVAHYKPGTYNVWP